MHIPANLTLISKKFFVGGEVSLEFMVVQNQAISAQFMITFKSEAEAAYAASAFQLGKEYAITLQEKEN